MAIAVLAILSGILLVGVFSAKATRSVRSGAQQFAGHLREAGLLAQNGVKAPGCGDASECSQYTVTFAEGANTYTRATVNGTSAITYTLPSAVAFADGGRVTFIYRPPVTTVSFDAQPPFTPAATAERFRLTVRGASAADVSVCVGPLGTVEVTPGGC